MYDSPDENAGTLIDDPVAETLLKIASDRQPFVEVLDSVQDMDQYDPTDLEEYLSR